MSIMLLVDLVLVMSIMVFVGVPPLVRLMTIRSTLAVHGINGI